MVKNKMAERHDYEAYFYRPVTPKYFQFTKELVEETRPAVGDDA